MSAYDISERLQCALTYAAMEGDQSRDVNMLEPHGEEGFIMNMANGQRFIVIVRECK